ncbi:GSCOCG00003522001-RA-CDS [Cotesia congregata]|uniref:Similar to Gtf3a: Transcription factor IIIA (Rattus norvegicus) n=1 Tax=Cotesia congregata TaxID=51543 RepID=A0A8J2H6D7_COTCN|nr:GSCOCG00003522001-RA-CDS [Cotesia congregata]CAG5077590.1 Similar to Gtf3a: Transcription factor IIIA (Rattus norvegicus) [Cotesia congregata]
MNERSESINNVNSNNYDESNDGSNCGDNNNKNHVKDSSKKKNLGYLHKCSFAGCERTFKKPSRLTWHYRQHTGERPYKCNFIYCGKTYVSTSHLRRHLKSHVPNHEGIDTIVLYRCGTCQSTFKAQTNLRKHYQRFHEIERLFCEECERFFRRKKKYMEHLARYHNGELFKCDYCKHEFKEFAKLKTHMKTHDTKYKCTKENCDVICDTYFELRRHSATHPKEYKCDKCMKMLSTSNLLKRHLATHEDKLKICPYNNCDKKYHHTNQLKSHIRIKHEKRVFQCDLCKKEFAYKVTLVKHISLTHSNEKSKIFEKDDKGKIKCTDKNTQNMLPASTELFSSEDDKSSINLLEINFEFVKVEEI